MKVRRASQKLPLAKISISGERDIILHTRAWILTFRTKAGYLVEPLKHLTVSRYVAEDICEILPSILLLVTLHLGTVGVKTRPAASDHSFQLQEQSFQYSLCRVDTKYTGQKRRNGEKGLHARVDVALIRSSPAGKTAGPVNIT